MRYGIVLSGGGARGAYQAGCLRALYEIGKEVGNLTPFETLIGLSAGAVNASYIAAEVGDLDYATDRLCGFWRQLRTQDVMRVDPFSISKTALKLLRQVTLGGLGSWLRGDRMSLLNTKPLARLLTERVGFENIQRNIEEKKLRAFCVTATDYSTSLGVTFFNGALDIEPWTRVQRMGRRSLLSVDHIMASSAIPIFFPPWPIGDRYFGDGCLRNTAPLSPAIHCGASKLIVLGAKTWKPMDLTPDTNIKPSLGRVLSVLINAILMDGIETDVERIRIINEAADLSGNQHFRRIEVFFTHPSKPLSDIAAGYVDSLPPVMRFLIGGLGSPAESAEILSYLAFEPKYASALIDLGYSDMQAQKQGLVEFLKS